MGAALLVTFASSLYEVQDEGRGPGIVPYPSGLLYKVRVLDAFTLYAPEEARPEADKLSGIALVAATTMTLVAMLLLGEARATRACGVSSRSPLRGWPCSPSTSSSPFTR